MQSTKRIWRVIRTAAIATAGAIAICLVPAAILAQVSGYGDKAMGPTNDKPPALLDGVGIAQRLDQQIPLNLTFTADAGQQVALGKYFGKPPAILALVY